MAMVVEATVHTKSAVANLCSRPRMAKSLAGQRKIVALNMYRATYGRVKGAVKGLCDLDFTFRLGPPDCKPSRSKAACRAIAPKSPQNWGALGVQGYWERNSSSKLIGSAHPRQHPRSQHSLVGAHAVDLVTAKNKNLLFQKPKRTSHTITCSRVDHGRTYTVD